MDIKSLTREQLHKLTLQEVKDIPIEEIKKLSDGDLYLFHPRQLIAILQNVLNQGA
jgi:hypothetical protein